MSMEVIQAASKDARDTLFTTLRETGTVLEKQAVKYSDVERQPDGSWKTVWLVAYPAGQSQY